MLAGEEFVFENLKLYLIPSSVDPDHPVLLTPLLLEYYPTSYQIPTHWGSSGGKVLHLPRWPAPYRDSGLGQGNLVISKMSAVESLQAILMTSPLSSACCFLGAASSV